MQMHVATNVMEMECMARIVVYGTRKKHTNIVICMIAYPMKNM